MTRASVKPALDRIEEMETKIEADVAEMKEIMKNGKKPIEENENSVDCLCHDTKKELEQSG